MFNKVKSDMSEFLNNLKVYPLSYIPVSAISGENILEPSEKMSWFKGGSIIEKVKNIDYEYRIGDSLPLNGLSYKYPEFF